MYYMMLFLLPLILFAKPFKVATYNVENLFDASYQGTEYEAYIPGKHNWNTRMVQIKLNHTAQVICDLDADILGLQEIENKNIFKQLIARLDKVGCAYRYSAITDKKATPIQVALLSRYPIAKQNQIQVSYTPGVRNILEVEIDIKGNRLTIFVNHWKSKAYKGYESKRIKYAKALQARIAKMSQKKEYIILGDFNSDYNAYMTLDEKIDDTKGRTAFNDILKTKIGAYLVEEDEMSGVARGVHYTLWKELPIDTRWNYKFYGKKSSLDQLVLPKNMFDAKGVDYVNNSFKVYKAPYLFTKRGYINRWQYKNAKHMAKGYSDHLPVYAYFDSKPYVGKIDKKHLAKSKIKPIEYFYKRDSLTQNIVLEDVIVVLKRGDNALIKQSVQGRGMYLFGCAGKLKEGYKYDLFIEKIKTYKGLKEVTALYKLKDKGSVKHKIYMRDAHSLENKNIAQNEVIRDINGVYKNRFLYVDGKKIPIYFKKRKTIPQNGSRLKIHYAHLGYYKRLQLVIHSRKDFDILEK